MTEPTAGGADVLTPHAMVFLQDRPIIAMSAALTEALDECVKGGRLLQIVTSPESRITAPLHTAVSLPEAQWVVQDNGIYYDGPTGHPMHWDGLAFTRDPDARDYAPGFVKPPSAPIGSHLVLTFQATHRPNAPLGGPVDQLMLLLTGQPPIGWGTSEPVEDHWDPSELTASVHTETEIPRLIIIGSGQRPAIATTEFSRSPGGITEMTILSIGYAPDDPPPISKLPSLIDNLTAEHPVTALLAQLNPGRADLTIEPRWAGPSAPIGLATAGAHTGPPGFTRQRIGPQNAPLTWFNLGDGRSPEHWRRHQELLTHLHTTP